MGPAGAWITLLVWTLFLLVVLGTARPLWLCWWARRRAVDLHLRGRQVEAVRLLERTLRRLGPGEELKDVLRFQLAWCHMSAERYADAAQLLRETLARRLNPTVEVEFRRRLADCLDGLGDAAGAEAERQRAADRLAKLRRDCAWYAARAEELARSRDYAGACAAYREALARVPRWLPHVGPEVRVRLGLTAYNAGRPEETVRCAEEALTGKPSPFFRMQAHAVAGIGLSALGRLDEAEAHRQEALRQALAAGNANMAGQFVTQIAILQMKQGRLVEAMASCERAAAMSLEARRTARLVEADCLRWWGRFDQAQAGYEQAAQTRPFPQPAEEQRFQALLRLARAMLELHAERPGAALEHLEVVGPELRDDARLGLWCDSLLACALAMSDRGEEARARLSGLESRALAFASDRETREIVVSTCARVYQALGDLPRACRLWEECAALPPDPVAQPMIAVHLAECREQLGEAAAAREALRRAVALGLDTHHTRQARQRLETLTAEGRGDPDC